MISSLEFTNTDRLAHGILHTHRFNTSFIKDDF
jgi:hypothetical protein